MARGLTISICFAVYSHQLFCSPFLLSLAGLHHRTSAKFISTVILPRPVLRRSVLFVKMKHILVSRELVQHRRLQETYFVSFVSSTYATVYFLGHLLHFKSEGKSLPFAANRRPYFSTIVVKAVELPDLACLVILALVPVFGNVFLPIFFWNYRE